MQSSAFPICRYGMIVHHQKEAYRPAFAAGRGRKSRYTQSDTGVCKRRLSYMNNKTLKITYGAMLIAIYGLILLLNRQTGGLLEGMMTYILPIPIAAFAVQYGGKASLTVFVCMVLLSFFFGTFTSVFYAISAAVLGMVLGVRIYHKKDLTKTMLMIMFLTMACELVSMVIIAQITTGVSLDQDVAQMEQMMQQMMQKAAEQSGQTGVDVSALIPPANMLKKVMLISIAISGGLEGFIVFQVTLLVLRKLRVQVPKPTPVTAYYPPRWTGYAAFIAYILYNVSYAKPFGNKIVQNVVQTVGICGYFMLICFGVIALWMVLYAYVSASKVLDGILAFFSVMIFPFVDMILGLLYLSGSLHYMLAEKIEEKRGGSGSALQR